MGYIKVLPRRVLGCILAATLGSVAGCGGGGDGTTPTIAITSPVNMAPAVVPGSALPAAFTASTSLAVKPALVYFEYDGDVLTTTQSELNTIPTDVGTTPDRFAKGALTYEFNGAASKVTIDDITEFPKTDFAVLFWVKASAKTQMEAVRMTGTDGTILSIGTSSAGLLSVLYNGKVIAEMPAEDAEPTVTDGTWHHVTVQRYGNSLQIYLDGILRASDASSQALPENATVQIGSGWNGAIDDMRLYNRAFPATSIPQAVYHWTQVKPISAKPDIEAYYPFNGNADSDLGNGLDGIPHNVSPTRDRSGAANAAYQFDGVTSYITLNQPLNSMVGNFGIGFWEQANTSARMIAIGASPGGVNGVSLDFVFNGSGALQVDINGSPFAGLTVGAVGELTNNVWHFVLLQRSGTELQLYVDGTLRASAQNESIFYGQSSVFTIGKGSGINAGESVLWNGVLDDVQILEVALSAQEIKNIESLQFRPRDGAGALTFNGKMWLLGGWNPGDTPITNNQVWSSADGSNWALVTRAPWEGRHDAGYAVLNGKMWIVGGDRNSGHYQNDVWSTADGVTWNMVTNNVPWANRATQYVLAFNNRLWLMGGQQIFEPPGPVVAFNDVYSSTDGASWQLETPNAAWSRRGIIMGSVVFQGKMWVIGGGQYDVRTFNNDVWNSADGVTWTRVVENAAWTARQFHNITVFDGKMWVLAGGDHETQGGLNDVWYSTNGSVWTQLEGTPWVPRHAASTFVQNNALWFTCGSDQSTYNDVWKMSYAP